MNSNCPLSDYTRYQLLTQYFETVYNHGNLADDLLPNLRSIRINELSETLFKCAEECRQNPFFLPEITITKSEYFDIEVSDKNNKCHIYISIGTLYALDDAFMRLSSCPNFLGTEALTGKLIEDIALGSILAEQLGYSIPEIRYLNYDQKINKVLLEQKNTLQANYHSNNESQYEYQGPHLDSFASGFYSMIPQCSHRHRVAQFMLEIALVWIIHHEKTHYNRGHLDYLDSNLHFHSLNETKTDAETDDQTIIKALEWDADNGATDAIFKIFNEKFKACLPRYAQSNVEEWLSRTIFTSIGVVQLILQKSRIHQGTDESHPSPKTRLSSAFLHQIYRAQGNIDTTNNIIVSFYASLNDISYASEILSEDGPIIGYDSEGKYIKSSSMKLNFIDNQDDLKKMFSLLNFIIYEDLPEDKKFTNCEIPTADRTCCYYGSLDKEWFGEVDVLGKAFHDLLPELNEKGYPRY